MSNIKKILISLLLLIPVKNLHSVSCTVGVSNFSFGDYNPFNGQTLEAVGTINISCITKKNQKYKISLSKGQFSNNFNPRKMSNGKDLLRYNLYRSFTKNKIWGDKTGNTKKVKGKVTKNNPNNSHEIYGEVFANQNVSTGSYFDTINVTVEF